MGSGLLGVQPGTRESVLQANSVRQALEIEGLLAVEWCDLNNPYPQAVEKLARPMARVLGSDCHSFRGDNVPGSRYTLVKLAQPTLEGLRLALLDSNGVSIRRSDEGLFDPFKTPDHLIHAIEIDNGRVIGQGQPARLALSPYFNSIVGGRGTGKSTVVHALRLATQREAEVQALPKDSEPCERFEAFCKISQGREAQGALRPGTTLRVEWQHETDRLRLIWRADGSRAVEEWREGGWQLSASQSVNPARFPLRIFSQGQIAAMAGSGRQALLTIIDEAAGVASLREAFDETRRAFFAQRARLREIEGRLASLPEVERRLQEAERKLQALAQGDQAAVQQAYALAQRQSRAVDETLTQLQAAVALLRETEEKLLLDDWLPQHFTERDAALLAWRSDADALLARTRAQLNEEARVLERGIDQLKRDDHLARWRTHADAAIKAHRRPQEQWAAQGVTDPQAFARLTQERQQLEAQAKALRQLQAERNALLAQIEQQLALIEQRRLAITEQRKRFLQGKLAQNAYVRIHVVLFGYDAAMIERSLRELLEVTDERFADDILKAEAGQPQSGLAFDIACADAEGKPAVLARVRSALLERPNHLGGRFRNFLERKAEKPEFADHVLTWFPEDDLRIEYQRDGKWRAISEGSQGQRSAALLAFLLAFGEEPIVLDQPEDDLDNHLIYDLIVRQIRENKLRRQLIVVTHNPNVVVNGDAELVHVMDFGRGQCYVKCGDTLQGKALREEVCQVMEGGREAFARRWKRLGREV